MQGRLQEIVSLQQRQQQQQQRNATTNEKPNSSALAVSTFKPK